MSRSAPGSHACPFDLPSTPIAENCPTNLKNTSAKVIPKPRHPQNRLAVQNHKASTAIVAITDTIANDPNAETAVNEATGETGVIVLIAPRDLHVAIPSRPTLQLNSDNPRLHSRKATFKAAKNNTQTPGQIAGQDDQIVADHQHAPVSPLPMISAKELTMTMLPKAIRPTIRQTNSTRADVADADKAP